MRHADRPDYELLRRQSFGYGVGLGAYLAHVAAYHPTAPCSTGCSGSATRRSTFSVGLLEERASTWASTPTSCNGASASACCSVRVRTRGSRFDTRRDNWTFTPPSNDYVQVDASVGTDT